MLGCPAPDIPWRCLTDEHRRLALEQRRSTELAHEIRATLPEPRYARQTLGKTLQRPYAHKRHPTDKLLFFLDDFINPRYNNLGSIVRVQPSSGGRASTRLTRAAAAFGAGHGAGGSRRGSDCQPARTFAATGQSGNLGTYVSMQATGVLHP